MFRWLSFLKPDNVFRNGFRQRALQLGGVFPPVTTPFENNGSIAYGELQKNIEKWSSLPFRGFVIQGSTGEFVFLTEHERVKLIESTRRCISKDKLLIAGSGCQSTIGTIDLTAKMAGAGADAALVITPSFYKGTSSPDALFEYYTKVADESPIPVIIYSVPSNTSVDIPAEVVIKLSNHPNIIGLKDSGGDVTKIGYIVHKTEDNNFQVLAGSAGFFLQALTIGCVGGVFAAANSLGKHIIQLHKLFQEGKLHEAKKLQHRLIAPNVAVTKKYGIAGVKKSMEWYGLYGGPPRSPLLPLPEDSIKQLRQDFKDSGFL